jgi:hypothetical protein
VTRHSNGPAEKRQLIDQLYFSMIEIGQHDKQAIETEANAD